jgi:nucleoside-diphosphate-sugar epimerase
MTIFLTGSSGFVGKNVISFFDGKSKITKYKRDSEIIINEDIVIHLAGKAHDLKNLFLHHDYYKINTDLTKKIFDAFLDSQSKVFIFLSSVKAVAEQINQELLEDMEPNPSTHYGKSKLLAEQYILNKDLPKNKRVYILRPCMIHGPGNKGNLNLLYNIVNKKIPWPLGAYNNKRSFCSIDNLCFIINELIHNENISSGIYNIADDEPITTNEIINLIGESIGQKKLLLNIPKSIVFQIAKIGNFLKLPLNIERLTKLTETYIVNNNKIKTAIRKPFPISSKDGIKKTLKSFSQNVQ